MRYLAIATDGDGTLTEHGRIEADVSAALERYRDAGGRVFLVTGETSDELAVFPRLDLFDYVVAENGGVLLNYRLGDERVLSEANPRPVVDALREIGARELKWGRVVVSAKEDERRMREALARSNLHWQIIHNRRDLLLLPRNINKATGLAALLEEIQLPINQIAAVGDAENDRVLIESCGFGVAVANAVPVLKEHAQMVTRGRAGRGVIELVDAILRDELP
jgi:hydroxymethylpyrimidine pyrophosphatase-like HAD family hydrolase